ncbi:MAG TPA: hypothetical protein VIK87_00720 [Sphingomonadales bacterium]
MNPEDFNPEIARLQLRLAEVRASARRAGRSRQALYELLAEILEIATELRANPAAYDGICRRAGIRVQSRAPFAPILKLVFGEDYDRTRIAEYGTALAHAERRGFGPERFLEELLTAPGGLKGVIQTERRLRQQAQTQSESGGPDEADADCCPDCRKTGGHDGELVLMLGRRMGNQNPGFELLEVLEDCPVRIRQMMQGMGRPTRQR